MQQDVLYPEAVRIVESVFAPTGDQRALLKVCVPLYTYCSRLPLYMDSIFEQA